MAKHKKKEKKHKKKTKHHHRHRHSSSDDGSDRRSSSGSSSSSSDSDAPEERLAEDDYYRKNAEFRHWLKHKKHKTLDDYSYDKRRKYFKKFVKYWNHGRLSQKYYDGGFAPGTGSSSGEYKWKFASSITGDERLKIAQTHAANAVPATHADTHAHAPAPSSSSSSAVNNVKRRAKPQGPSMVPPAEELSEYNRNLSKKAKKDFRKHHNLVMDELVPRETGRDARISKRKGANEARRARAVSPDPDDATLMGNDQFKAYMQRRKYQQERERSKRKEKAMARVSQHEQEEKAKMSALLEMARASKHANALWKS